MTFAPEQMGTPRRLGHAALALAVVFVGVVSMFAGIPLLTASSLATVAGVITTIVGFTATIVGSAHFGNVAFAK